ncbi:MAG: EAL domain-containing protein [Hyphomicrobiales bacterium]
MSYLIGGNGFGLISLGIVALSALNVSIILINGARRQTNEGSRRNLHERNSGLETALDNMSQALCMFDAQQRLVVCNRRYAEIFDLPHELRRPGTTLRQILEFRVAKGLYGGTDPDAYIRDRLTVASQLEPSKSLLEFRDGRVFSVSHEPMAGGGWVATHEDVTEHKRAERELARTRGLLSQARAEAEGAAERAQSAHARLLDALEVVPERLALFDAEDRFVLWNRRYAEMYADSADSIAAGMLFEDVLRVGLARDQYPEAKGREKAWLADRLARHAQPRSGHEQQLPGGRWVRIDERRTADGGSIGVRIDITDLKRREESFRLLFEGNPIPMWVYDRCSLRFLAVNDAAIAHYGYSREQFLAMSILDIRPAEDRYEVGQISGTGDGDYRKGQSWRHLTADGTEIEVAVYSRSMRYDGRDGMLVAAIDITERRRTEDELQRTQEFLNTVIENVPEAIIVKDAREHRYVLVNRASEEFLGFPRREIIGKTARDLYPKEAADIIAGRDEQLVLEGRQLFLDAHVIDTPRNGPRLVTVQRVPLIGKNRKLQYLLTVIEDVTDRKRAEERIAYLAHHDVLTELPNRAAFNERLASTLEEAASSRKHFALLCVDLDRFKEVNDVFGHPVGDGLLREVSRRLSAAAEGAFLARLGGDEFTLILPDCAEPATAVELADRLLAAISGDFDINGKKLRIGLCIGVAMYPADGIDATTLLGNADAALYRAKADGRGATRFFEADMDKRLRERRALQHDLESAIERNELSLHYQPQARVGGGITGFEALLRWRHPVYGMVPPSTFIPAAEESGLIIPIGEWILREVCREASSWPRSLQVAVNLSPVHFQHGDLPALVHTVLLETGLGANRLELEITEGVLIGDRSRALSILRQLKSLGVRVAMDDFGTGYSSLSYLQSFPFDRIKIDRAFVANVERNPQSAAIIRAVLGLSRGLYLPVIAEGVETEEQLAFLAREQCDQVQGYLIGRPLPISDYCEVVGRSAMTARTSA